MFPGLLEPAQPNPHTHGRSPPLTVPPTPSLQGQGPAGSPRRRRPEGIRPTPRAPPPRPRQLPLAQISPSPPSSKSPSSPPFLPPLCPPAAAAAAASSWPWPTTSRAMQRRRGVPPSSPASTMVSSTSWEALQPRIPVVFHLGHCRPCRRTPATPSLPRAHFAHLQEQFELLFLSPLPSLV